MLELMYVRCAHCGYDNSPEYRFCGMCGGSLPHPAKEISQPQRDVVLPPVAAPITPPIRNRALAFRQRRKSARAIFPGIVR